MKEVWIVWEWYSAYPEEGGGRYYLNKIFEKKADAIAYCDKCNKESEADEDYFYCIQKWSVN